MLPNENMASRAMPDDVIFALDIGTRTIIGIVGVQEDERFLVHAVEILAHESRAMLDGQIHDIGKVVQGVIKVKSALEMRLGYQLTRVSIAAAGRVLKTSQVRTEREIDEGRQIDSQLVSALEMEGIQKAQLEIESGLNPKDKNQFYCVGYSVVSYYLNDYVISSLTGHKGNKAGVEILATFLPQMVVDSLYTVMERTGLEVTHLTLEPIAALNLAIPKDLRLLNLALVDIGAGTSDIAITKSGTIVAYAMVSIAGDEITEAIAQHYLVDFNTAEKIKVTLSNNEETVSFTDILDNEVKVCANEVNQVIYPVVESLARTISERILEYNGAKAPNAIFLVGGGSQTRGLGEAISNIIGLPKERVAVRNRSIAKNIIIEEDILQGPDSITPLGIMVTTGMTKNQDFFYVTVNGSKIRMYNSRRMSVSDALILAGFNPEQLICKSGRNLRFTFNGNSRTIRGTFGKPAEIYVNNDVSGLNAFITPGDALTVIPAEKGFDGKAYISDLLKETEPIYLKFGDNTVVISPRMMINGEKVSAETEIKDGDHVELLHTCTLKDIAERYEMDPLVWEFTVNGCGCDIKTVIKAGEQVVGIPKAAKAQMLNEKAAIPDAPAPGPNQETVSMQSILKQVGHKLAERDGIMVKVNGKSIDLPPKRNNYMFVDIFNHIDFDLSTPKGVIMLKLNGKEANFTDIIKSGDVIDIYWGE